jgi:hypothetical protein
MFTFIGKTSPVAVYYTLGRENVAISIERRVNGVFLTNRRKRPENIGIFYLY